MAKRKTLEQAEAQEKKVDIPLKWGDFGEVQTVYANQMVITHIGDEFYLVFGEVELPILLGTPGEQIPESLRIRPTARIAIAPDVMVRFANAISENVSKYQSKVSSRSESTHSEKQDSQ